MSREALAKSVTSNCSVVSTPLEGIAMDKEVIPGLEGVPIAESAISRVDGAAGKLEYRGISVEQLADLGSFEETSWLLLYGELPTSDELAAFTREMAGYRRLKYRVIDLIKCLPETGHPMDALQAAVAAIGMFYPTPRDLDDSAKKSACMRLIAKLPSVVAAFERIRRGDEHILPRTDLGHAANFLYMLTGEEPDVEHTHVLDVCLILHADHTMNASTFAGRVVGSTLADPYCVVSSALGALSGPLHGGANETAMALFREIGSPENARPVIEKMIAEKAKIPGFGHRVYRTIDPRAKVLKTFAKSLAEKSGNPECAIANEVEKVMAEHYGEKGIWPNVDLYSGIVYHELGISTECFTPIFAISRVSGWLAHWLEQRIGNRIFRPTQKYVGKSDRSYTPMIQR